LRTYTPKPADIVRQWHVIDADDVVLGRLASQAAQLLRGKHKAYYAPHMDTGDFVVIVNAGKVAMTATRRRSPRSTATRATRASHDHVLRRRPRDPAGAHRREGHQGHAPAQHLGRQMLSKLKVYAGPTHPHQAQSPVPYELKQVSQ
jgi:large subunit ribosomal protein L13